ncbi:MAG: type II toxin-antitoxin system RelE/ParE family toxin [Lachnospiraceae bacterium]
MVTRYKVVVAKSAKEDVKAMKRYILKNFRYRELAENFSKKTKCILSKLDTFPDGHQPTKFSYRGYKIYIKPRDTYLVFYTVNGNTVTILRVMQDGMNWQFVLKRWIAQNK